MNAHPMPRVETMARRALILLGPPGAGKGTQGRKLMAHLGYPSISTGDALRAEIEKQSNLGNAAWKLMEAGELVPDSLVNEIVQARLTEPDSRNGFILDGYPRTISQAEFLEKLAARESIDTLAIGIRVDDEILVERLIRRWNCTRCGRIFSLDSDRGVDPRRCKECGAELAQRRDDRPEVVRERLQIYRQTTRPLIDFYRQRGQYVEVDGKGSEDLIFESIVGIVNGKKRDRTASQ
jgi:adenylate kinase